MPGGEGLCFEDVQACPGQPLLAEGLHQRGLVHQVPPRGVDQDRPGLEEGQALPVEEVACLRRGPKVQGDDVRGPQQVLQLDVAKPQPSRQVRVRVEGPGHHLHPQAPGHGRHFASDQSGSDDPEALTAKLEDEVARPAPLPDRLIGLWELFDHRQHQGDGVFRDGDGIGPWRVGHGDPPGRRRLEIHVIRPRAPDGDQAEPGAGLQDVGREPSSPPDVHCHIGVP
jgi:hypothetical protein